MSIADLKPHFNSGYTCSANICSLVSTTLAKTFPTLEELSLPFSRVALAHSWKSGGRAGFPSLITSGGSHLLVLAKALLAFSSSSVVGSASSTGGLAKHECY